MEQLIAEFCPDTDEVEIIVNRSSSDNNRCNTLYLYSMQTNTKYSCEKISSDPHNNLSIPMEKRVVWTC